MNYSLYQGMSVMKKILLSTAMLLAVTGSVSAADLPQLNQSHPHLYLVGLDFMLASTLAITSEIMDQ